MKGCFEIESCPQVLAEVSDEFTGVSSLVSCVYWDSEAHTWSDKGIAFVDAYYGDATGQGDLVDPTVGIHRPYGGQYRRNTGGFLLTE